MPEEVLELKEDLIDAQAEAAKAAERVAAAEHTAAVEESQAIAEVIASAPEPQDETDEDIEWLRSEISSIKSELSAMKELLSQSNNQLQQQLIQSMTEVFQTALTAALLTQQVSATPQEAVTVETPANENGSPVVTPESAEVPINEPPKQRRRKI